MTNNPLKHINLPVVDISGQAERHAFVARGNQIEWNGHPSTVLLPDGKTIFCVWQARRDGTRQHGAPGGFMKRSDDGGQTWSDYLDLPANWREIGRGSPTIQRLVDGQGKARLFVFCRDENRTTFLVGISEDDGASWSELRPIGLAQPEAGPITGWTAPITILEATATDGRRKHLMWYERSREGNPEPGVIWQSSSYDDGSDWEFDEHMMVQLRDGRIWMLARTKHQPFESFSADNGATWTTPRQAATVQNINSRFFLRRLASGRILLVKNGSPVERLAQRTHMSAWLSEDEGRTWQGGLLLDERGAVSYPDGFEAPDGLIHILYDWNRHTDAEILLATFREADVLAGQLVSPDARLRLLANKATGPKPEVLSNGVELSLPWPPPFLDPESDEPMALPYLHWPHRPHVVPIDVGRQLFVDDFLIAETTLQRAFHLARKHDANPVMRPETPLEKATTGLFPAAVPKDGGVWWDPQDALFKMWYEAGWCGAIAYATSKDGIHWERPTLDVAPPTNQVVKGLVGDSGAVVLDLDTDNPAQRYKLFHRECNRAIGMGVGPGNSLVSADGIHWSEPVKTGPVGDRSTMFYNPFRKRWVYSIRSSTRGRTRHYREHDDFLAGARWTGEEAVFWCGADCLDAPDPDIGDPANPMDTYGFHGGVYSHGSTGIAKLRRDGFASMTADSNEGTLTTRPLTFSGKHLFVNAAVRDGGALRAELLDRDGQVIAPFTRDMSVPFTGIPDCVPVAPDFSNNERQA